MSEMKLRFSVVKQLKQLQIQHAKILTLTGFESGVADASALPLSYQALGD